jgi:hypothetical protein
VNAGGVSAAGVVGSGGTVGSGVRDAGSPDASDGKGRCNFSFSVTTVSYAGEFSPRNVGATWIESGSGAFVKTLHTWGRFLLRNAVQWNSVSGGNGVDAVTSATRPNSGPMTDAWDCTDAVHAGVPDGTYSVCVEFEEDNVPPTGGPLHYACNPFALGARPANGTWPDVPNFVSMSWALE